MDRLCQSTLKPETARMTLQWEGFNDFGNSKFNFVESGFLRDGEGDSCKIRSTRSDNKTGQRPCGWTDRLSCELEFGMEPITHKFSSGTSLQYGKLDWASNGKLLVKVKRGELSSEEWRDVALIKFDGSWSRGIDRGRSVSTAYYDRAWGVLLKVEGAHDANKWGETVSLVVFSQ